MPSNWNSLNKYSAAVDTLLINASTIPGDTMVGKQIIFYSADVSLNPEPGSFPKFYGITPGATYTIQVSNICTTYTKSQFVSASVFSRAILFRSGACIENTAQLDFRFRNLPLITGFIKYTINSGPTTFTDQNGNIFSITYPIIDPCQMIRSCLYI